MAGVPTRFTDSLKAQALISLLHLATPFYLLSTGFHIFIPEDNSFINKTDSFSPSENHSFLRARPTKQKGKEGGRIVFPRVQPSSPRQITLKRKKGEHKKRVRLGL